MKLPSRSGASCGPHILMLSPNGGHMGIIGDNAFFRLTGTYRFMPPLGLLTVAGHLPRDWPVRLIDENVRPVPDEALDWADYVLLTGMYSQTDSLALLCERASRRGKRVIVGGPFATASYGSLKGRHGITTFCFNECETYIGQLVDDLASGDLKPLYGDSGRRPVMEQTAVPRFDLLPDLKRYLMASIQVSRGCPFECDFCDVPTFAGRQMRYKSPEQVCAELDALRASFPRGQVFICDDNLTGSPPAASKLMAALADWQRDRDYPFAFTTQLSVNVADDPALLDRLYEANVRNVFCGVESVNEQSLIEAGKRQNLRGSIVERLERFIQAGIEVNAYLIVGFDNDPPDIARRQLGLIQRAKVTLVEPTVLVALDNTKLGRRMAAAERILYSTTTQAHEVIARHAVGLPNFETRLPPATLQASLAELIEGLYAPRNWYDRTRRMTEALPERDREHLGLPMKWSWASAMLALLALLLLPSRLRLVREALRLYRDTRAGWRVWRFVYACFATGVSINGYRRTARRIRAHLARAQAADPGRSVVPSVSPSLDSRV